MKTLTPVLDTVPTRNSLKILLWALAVLMVPHTLYLSPLVSTMFYAMLAWRWFALERGWRMPLRLVRAFLAIVVFVMVFSLYGTISGAEAGTALLTTMMALKLTELVRVRDGVQMVILGFFVIFAGFLYTQEISHVVLQLPALPFLAAALMIVTHNEEKESLGPALRSAGRFLLQAAPFAIVLFVLFPRIPGPLWGMPQAGGDAVSGLSDEMTPGSITNLVMSDEVAFRVRFEGTPPPQPVLYWRGPVLHLFNGRTWGQGFLQITDTERYIEHGNRVNYEVMLEPHSSNWLYALDVPVKYPPDAALTRDFMLAARKSVTQRRQYEITSALDHRLGEELTGLEKRWSLQLPRRFNPRAQILAQQWLAESQSPREIVSKALRMFREQPFVYTLQPPLLRGDTVDDFLFNTQRGFCEHYASAFTFLMRAAGIPARVVTGYQGGELNTLSGFVVVRQSDAHAWSEVWFDDEGWVRIDPTAAVSPDRIEQGISAAFANDASVPDHILRRGGDLLFQMKLRWDAVNALWSEFFLAYGPETQAAFLEWLGMNNPHWEDMVLALAVILGIFTVLLAAYLLRLNRPPQIDAAGRIFYRLRMKLDPAAALSEGPADFIQRMRQQHPGLGNELMQFAELYLACRYGPQENASKLLVRLRTSAKILLTRQRELQA